MVGQFNIVGLIPAHAGKTSNLSVCWCVRWAHPRSRGENLVRHVEPVRGLGSSPLTRGKQDATLKERTVARLIPAHAGKTILHRPQHRPQGAHPRSRGENNQLREALEAFAGSSPLTRGKRNGLRPRHAGTGLIPAHAGKTRGWRDGLLRARAHPRSRGENKDGAGKDLIRWGSSPLTRGKRPDHRRRHGGRLAHPRSRGENVVASREELLLDGSSPLTRGKHGGLQRRGGLVGLIPAHAGKTR